jgi:aspartate ammonia-lyase
MRMLAAGLDTLTRRCVEGIEADVERCRGLAINSIGIVTALNPVLGYEVCSRIAKRALEENRSVLDVVLEEGVLTKEQVTKLLRPEKMTQPARATIA